MPPSPSTALVVLWSVRRQRRSEEHTSELQSHDNLVCRLLLKKKILHAFHGPLAEKGFSVRGCVEPLRSESCLVTKSIFFFFYNTAPPDFTSFSSRASFPT